MISFELNLNYKETDNDDIYRDQFLKFFKIEDYDEERIKDVQTFVYTTLKDNNKFKQIINIIKTKYSEFSDEHAYMILYSFENFDLFSEIIKKLYKNTLDDSDFKSLEENILIE
tara:strand:+ start:297 stop:638 length:342 start_codon:yes stop_codon:yes gene_type:complete